MFATAAPCIGLVDTQKRNREKSTSININKFIENNSVGVSLSMCHFLFYDNYDRVVFDATQRIAVSCITLSPVSTTRVDGPS